MSNTTMFRVYIKATPEKIWEAITSPEWNDRYVDGRPLDTDLDRGGVRSHHCFVRVGPGEPGEEATSRYDTRFGMNGTYAVYHWAVMRASTPTTAVTSLLLLT